MKTFAREHWLFILILLSAIVFRFIPLFDYQFTFDEWSGLRRTPFNSFAELIERGVKIDTHPAFVQVLIYYLSKIFGYQNWIIKLPFLLFSLGAIVYAYGKIHHFIGFVSRSEQNGYTGEHHNTLISMT